LTHLHGTKVKNLFLEEILKKNAIFAKNFEVCCTRIRKSTSLPFWIARLIESRAIKGFQIDIRAIFEEEANLEALRKILGT